MCIFWKLNFKSLEKITFILKQLKPIQQFSVIVLEN